MNQARFVAALRELIAAVEDDGDFFTCDNLPPGVSRRTFRAVSRTIESAEIDGHRIRVHRDDWYRARRTSRARPTPSSFPPANDDATFRDLLASGLRRTRTPR